MRILITSPSLDEHENVSGISSLVRTIINNSDEVNEYFHFRLGKTDKQKTDLKWFIDQLLLLPNLFWFTISNKIELVHLNTGFEKPSLVRDFLVFCIVKYILRRKTFFHIHGGYFLMNAPRRWSLLRFIIKRMLNDSDRKIVLSNIEKTKIIENYNIECSILPNAVEIDHLPASHKNFSNRLTFVFLGRIVKSKGIDVIAEAFRHLEKEYKNFDFHIYGAGPELDSFLQQLQSCRGLNFTYYGVTRGPEKFRILDRSHIFLLPSLHGEGLPIAMLEAMGNGCIPIVSDDASITSVVQNEQNGFVVLRGNVQALVQTVRQIFRNRNKLASMSLTARSTINENYNIKSYLSKLNKFYHESR